MHDPSIKKIVDVSYQIKTAEGRILIEVEKGDDSITLTGSTNSGVYGSRMHIQTDDIASLVSGLLKAEAIVRKLNKKK